MSACPSRNTYRAQMGALAALALALALARTDPAGAGHLFSSVDEGALAEDARTDAGLYLSPEDAWRALEIEPDIVFIDVRTRPEFAYVGHPVPIDANIPLRFFSGRFEEAIGGYALEPNKNFVRDVTELIGRLDVTPPPTLLLIGREERRAAKAADLLTGAGFAEVYIVVEGFEGPINPESGLRDLAGWRNRGLPARYRIAPGTAYPRRVRIRD